LGLASLLGLALAQGSELTGGPQQPAKAPPIPLPVEKAQCSGHGTSIDFVDTPSEAAGKAKKEEKLVFILHVSGHFEDPRFT
jgi:hypothetical protein